MNQYLNNNLLRALPKTFAKARSIKLMQVKQAHARDCKQQVAVALAFKEFDYSPNAVSAAMRLLVQPDFTTIHHVHR